MRNSPHVWDFHSHLSIVAFGSLWRFPDLRLSLFWFCQLIPPSFAYFQWCRVFYFWSHFFTVFDSMQPYTHPSHFYLWFCVPATWAICFWLNHIFLVSIDRHGNASFSQVREPLVPTQVSGPYECEFGWLSLSNYAPFIQRLTHFSASYLTWSLYSFRVLLTQYQLVEGTPIFKQK